MWQHCARALTGREQRAKLQEKKKQNSTTQHTPQKSDRTLFPRALCVFRCCSLPCVCSFLVCVCVSVVGYEREYTAAEVAQHNKDDDCWLIIHGKVYDVNGFLVDHPGGPEVLTNEAGTDATQKFEEVFHSPDSRRQLKDFSVGTLKGYTGPADAVFAGKNAGSSATSTESGASPAVYLLALAAVAALAYVFIL